MKKIDKYFTSLASAQIEQQRPDLRKKDAVEMEPLRESLHEEMAAAGAEATRKLTAAMASFAIPDAAELDMVGSHALLAARSPAPEW